MRKAVATRLRTRRLFVNSTLPPLIFFSGQSPSHDAKAEAFRNRETSVPISHKMVWAVIALIVSTPLIRGSLRSCGCYALCGRGCLQLAQLELNLLIKLQQRASDS